MILVSQCDLGVSSDILGPGLTIKFVRIWKREHEMKLIRNCKKKEGGRRNLEKINCAVSELKIERSLIIKF